MGRLIIELLHPHDQNVESRYVFDEGKASIGRSYANDIILDDPFVSPKHLTVSHNGAGLFVTDLTSENGTRINGSGVLKGKGTRIASGAEICIGNTKLKLILPDHPVEPAQPLGKIVALRRLVDRRSFAIIFTVFLLTVLAGTSYMGAPNDKFWKNDLFESVMRYFGVAAVYVGIVGFISYLKFKKAYIKRHLAAINATTFLLTAYFTLEPFLLFWVSSPSLVVLEKYVVMFCALTALLWASLRLVKDLLKWKDLAKVSGLVLLFVLFSAWESNAFKLKYSSYPDFPAHLAPLLTPLSEPEPLEIFLEKSSKELFKPSKTPIAE